MRCDLNSIVWNRYTKCINRYCWVQWDFKPPLWIWNFNYLDSNKGGRTAISTLRLVCKFQSMCSFSLGTKYIHFQIFLWNSFFFFFSRKQFQLKMFFSSNLKRNVSTDTSLSSLNVVHMNAIHQDFQKLNIPFGQGGSVCF